MKNGLTLFYVTQIYFVIDRWTIKLFFDERNTFLFFKSARDNDMSKLSMTEEKIFEKLKFRVCWTKANIARRIRLISQLKNVLLSP